MIFLRWLYNQPYILIFLATLFWAGNAVAGKAAVGHISPFLLTSLRWLFALTLLSPFAIQHLKSDWNTIKPRLLFLFVLGSIGFTVFNNMMYLALNTTSAINATIIQSSLPLFVFILNILYFSVRVNKFQVIGFPITIVGVVVITCKGELSELTAHTVNIGDLLMLVAVAAYGFYSAFLTSKPNIHWLSTLAVLGIAAFISSIPFTVFEVLSGDFNAPDLTGFSVVIYTAIFASLAAQSCWIRSIELIGSNPTSVFINLVPFFGVLLAVTILGEKLHLFHAIGIVFIFVGIYIGRLKATKS